MKKVIIIGAGIAGLSAGIYLQKAGFETEIYEKNSVAGGECIGWTRDGYTIDNCIHWLTGTKKDLDVYKMWSTIGALGDGIECYESPRFARATDGKNTVTLWRDAERTRRELTELSPEDKAEIDLFIDCVKAAEKVSCFPSKPIGMMKPGELLKLAKESSAMSSVMKAYGKENVNDFATRFKNPLIRKVFLCSMLPDFQAYSLVFSYATVTSGSGDIPVGGSMAMRDRIVDRYESLGGKIHLNAPVAKILVDGKMAAGIKLCDGTELNANYIVPACDTSFTFGKLLPEEYMPKGLHNAYENEVVYPVTSATQIAFAVDGVFDELNLGTIFEGSPVKVGTKEITCFGTRGYNYEPSFAPKGKSVLQCYIIQEKEDYLYWKDLYLKDREQYKKEKMIAAEAVMAEIVKFYAFLEGKLRILDVWTPVSYERYCNAYRGSYMAFIISKSAKMLMVSNKIKGLKNVFVASQWLMAPGGLPTAAEEGKFAAQWIMKSEKVNIIV